MPRKPKPKEPYIAPEDRGAPSGALVDYATLPTAELERLLAEDDFGERGAKAKVLTLLKIRKRQAGRSATDGRDNEREQPARDDRLADSDLRGDSEDAAGADGGIVWNDRGNLDSPTGEPENRSGDPGSDGGFPVERGRADGETGDSDSRPGAPRRTRSGRATKAGSERVQESVEAAERRITDSAKRITGAAAKRLERIQQQTIAETRLLSEKQATDDKVLSDLMAAYADYFKYADEILSETNRAGATARIWSDHEDDEMRRWCQALLKHSTHNKYSAWMVTTALTYHELIMLYSLPAMDLWASFRFMRDNGGVRFIPQGALTSTFRPRKKGNAA